MRASKFFDFFDLRTGAWSLFLSAAPLLLAAAALLLSGLACAFGTDAARAGLALNRPAPALVLTRLDGRIFDLSKMRGKVVLVNYWATWCAPCKKEMPILSEFYRRHHKEGFELIGISTDRASDYQKMRRMSQTLDYPTALFKDISNNGFGTPEGFPLTYVVDKDGVIRDEFIEVRDELLTSVVLPLLHHASAARSE